MNIKIAKIAKVAWGIFGEKALGKAASSSAAQFIDDLCQRYNVKDEYAQDLKCEVKNLIEYMAACMLNGDDIDTNYVNQKLEGPISDVVLKSAYSSNDGDNFLAEIINKLDDESISEVERFLLQAGARTGYDYIKMLHNMLQTIREKAKDDEEVEKEEVIITAQPQKTSSSFVPSEERSVVSSSDRVPAYVHDGMTEKEDQEFINNLTNDIGSALMTVKKTGKIGPAQMVEMTKLFIDKSAEVAKFCEVQKTKRVQIRSQAQVAIHQIDAIRDVLKDYLERSFDERRKIFDKEFEVVDKCLANGDTQALAVTLNSITALAQSSPFKALADLGSVRNTLVNKGTFDI